MSEKRSKKPQDSRYNIVDYKQDVSDQIGFNIIGLKYLKNIWDNLEKIDIKVG